MTTLAEHLLAIVVDCQKDIRQLGEREDLIALHNEAVDLFNKEVMNNEHN